MKNKLLLFLLIYLFLGNSLNANNSINRLNFKKYSSANLIGIVSLDTVKKKNIVAKVLKVKALIPAPLTTAGSTCKDPSLPATTAVDVFINASGGSGDLIEWFDSQTSTAILYTGSIYRAKVSKTTTFYVQTHSGSDFSIRVPVVASVYLSPSPVVLSVTPTTLPVCDGTPLTFTASGGADLFEFSIDGTIVQPMSSSRTYTTSTLTNGQTVKVRTRYAVTYDGSITETAWGTSNLEDNMLSASLSPSAIDGYINSIKISSTEDKLVFGVSGKLGPDRSMLLFLDTKPGGFNITNYGDDTVSPFVKGFNFLNSNPSNFDSYFLADYCLAVSQIGGVYVADLIELKTGNSTKVNLWGGSAGFPTDVFAVNTTNSGITDYIKGFEVGVLKSALGYSVGDIKFFGVTVRDDSAANFSISNSFLSPEITNTSDYGNGAVDFNFASPNPVVVSSDALIPCYTEDSLVINIVPLPTITGIPNVCIGLTTSLTGSGTPNATNPWVSASPSVATVDNFGIVTGVSIGTSDITYTNNNGCTITQTVTVNALPTITGTPVVCVGSTTTLTGSATPNATNPWVSATPSVATISSSGVVTGVSAGTSLITYTNSNGCTITQTVTVNALPTITGTPNVCIGLTTTLIGSATPNATNPWVSSTPSVATITSSGVVTGVSVGTTIITYTNSDGCETTQTFTVNPLPTITGTPTVCVGLTTTLTGSATPSTTNPWVSGTPSVATVNSSGVVTGVSGGTSEITYTNSNGCTVTQTVTVNPLPTITGTPSVCVGFTTTLIGSATPNATNPWVSASPSVATVNSSGVVTGVSGGTSVITYTNSNGCTVDQIFTVYATPTISGTPNVCIGLTTALTGSGAPNATNPWVSASPSVATITSSGVVTGVSAGTSVIRYTDNNGCTITQTVTVNALPTITGNPIVCVGSTTTLTGSATPNATNPWVSATPSVATISSSGVVTGVSAGTSLITYTNSNGCTITQTVTVNALPTITGTPNVCIGLTTTLIGSATPNATNPWVSSTPSVATITSSGVVTGVSVGTTIITYTNSDGCETTQTFTVNPLPTITGTPTVCVGLTTTLTGSATPSTTNPWVSGTPSVATVNSSGVVTGVSGGTSEITYTNSNGCTVTQTVTVNPLPTITGTPSVCVGFTTTLIGSATPNATNPWVSASPSVATVNSSGVVTGVSGGTSVITYTNSNGCTVDQIFTVYATPTISGTPNVCIGLTTALTGSGAPNATNPWVSASPSVATITSSGVVTGVSAGTSVIRYTDNNGCTITQTVTVNALPTITGNPIVCVGSTTTLTGSATPNATNPWVSATPSVATISSSGVVTGVSAGTSLITYTNSNGCTITQTVTVNALPTITGTPNVCIGLTTTLIGSATPNATNPWVSSTPSVATITSSGVVTGVSVGTTIITYTNSDGCETTQTFTVNPLPTITGTPTVCVGLTTTLTGSATPSTTNPWVSGTPSVATVNSSGVVTGVSGGTSEITYTNSNGCTVTQTVTVNPLPTITGTPSVCVGFTTTLIGSATPNATNPWVSASPSVATVNSSGVVTGVSGGTSVITYTNSNGCTVDQIFTVYATPTISGTPNVCIGLTTALTGSGAPNATNPWVSASPSVATITSSGVVTGVSAGTSVIRYTDNNGCTITQTVTVNALPTITGNPIVCVGSTTTLTGSATPNATNPWVSATPSVATISSSGVVTGVSAGTSLITYTNSNGCTITQTVTVNALPTITGTPNVCIGLTTTLIGSATPNATNPWVSSTPSVATITSSGVVTGVSVGTTIITYTNTNGCVINQTFTVNALPVATLSSNDSDNTFCSGTSVTFTASGGVSYNFRVNNLSVQSGSSAIYITSSLTNGQTVDVVVSNAAGCTSISSLITNTVLLTPVQPTLNIIAQPNCISSSGSFKISNYNASFTYTISPSAGVVRSADMVTAPSGNYLVTAISGVCSSSASITVNAIPPQIQFESSGDCVDKNYILTATPLNNSYDSNTVNYEWKDNLGNVVGTNSNVLNATDAVRSMTGTVSYPLTFTLKVSSDLTKCSTVNSVTIESVFCNIQKGISPDGNGSNDYFDLKLLDVKKLEIFDRYGIKVYNRVNYTDQWKGQSDNGNELPSATYYYVIEFNNGMTKTGWIYLIREK